MKLQQLRYALEVYKQNLNVSDAAEVLFTSQPGISKQIRLLEEEIGVPIFVRQGKRLVSVTEPGEMVLSIAERILRDSQNIQKIGQDFAKKDTGKLNIAATPLWGKYHFPKIVQNFIQSFPEVKLSLQTGSLDYIYFLLENSQADLGIIAGNAIADSECHSLPFDSLKYQLIIRKNHPLKDKQLIDLQDLINYPILCEKCLCQNTNNFQNKFAEMALDTPDIIMTTDETDMIFSLVKQKYGIGIVSQFVLPNDDDFIVKDLSHLFADIPLSLILKNNQYLHGYALHFIEQISHRFNAPLLQKLLYQPITEDYSI